jgi:hypothetical protein
MKSRVRGPLDEMEQVELQLCGFCSKMFLFGIVSSFALKADVATSSKDKRRMRVPFHVLC